jgi:hypothetical protein
MDSAKKDSPMNEKITKPTPRLEGAVAALCRHMLEKGNHCERGPAYEGDGKVLASVRDAVRTYESLGYVKLFEFGDPPVYALMQRGQREAHLFQPQDPKIRQWLDGGTVSLSDPALGADPSQPAGLTGIEASVAANPHRFHINEVDEVFIVTTDD